jgi:hypothetical protein
MIGRGGSGYRRGHLRALDVILRSDDGYCLPPSLGAGGNSKVPPTKVEADHLNSVHRHFVTYRLVWLLLAALAVAGNEVVDQVVWDERHVADADILTAIGVVAIAFCGSLFKSTQARRPSRSA